MNSSLYRRPLKPLFMDVTRRSDPAPLPSIEHVEPMAVHADSQCFVTPPDVAARMAEYLDATCEQMTLEPSAGTGNLVQAMIDNGHSIYELMPVERNRDLFNAMRQRTKVTGGYCNCFLDYAEEHPATAGYFSRIIMNPPFKGIKKHMNAAINMLGNAGFDGRCDSRLIALVPVTYQHDEASTLEELPNDTFAGIKVNTKIIEIER